MHKRVRNTTTMCCSLCNAHSTRAGWSLEWRNSSRWTDVTLASTDRSHWLKRLSCGQTYQVRMRAVNQEGGSVYSHVISAQSLGGSMFSTSIYLLILVYAKSVNSL